MLWQLKLYHPSSALTESERRASDVLFKWLGGVLHEHGLKFTDIYSSTSDSGSDIKRLLDVLLDAEWAWCVPHMANRALTDGMGSHENPAKSKNPTCRAEIKKVKSVVEHLHKSPKMEAKFNELQVSITANYHAVYPLQCCDCDLPALCLTSAS